MTDSFYENQAFIPEKKPIFLGYVIDQKGTVKSNTKCWLLLYVLMPKDIKKTSKCFEGRYLQSSLLSPDWWQKAAFNYICITLHSIIQL